MAGVLLKEQIMRGRLTQNDVTNTVNVEDADAVNAAVRRIFEQRYPGVAFPLLDRAFADAKRLFGGQYPGYFACDTLYHDLRHTLDMTLALARLIDGHDRTHVAEDQIGPQRALVGIVIALFHDAGYIRERSDNVHRNGAEFTKIHVSRSAAFLARYLDSIGLGRHAAAASKIVHFTGYEVSVDKIDIEHALDRKLGYMLGSADLLGQMSDRLYLEKCRDYLYQEFVWGGIARERLADGSEKINYHSPEDLLAKTPTFYQRLALKRLDSHFDGVYRYAEMHFGGGNLYLEGIGCNINYLNECLANDDLSRLRRQSISLSLAPPVG